MLNKHVTSKAEIAKELNLSMPTVLANVNDLLEKMVLEETGEYASTGGRKAKSIGINKSYCHAMGILIKFRMPCSFEVHWKVKLHFSQPKTVHH